MLRYLLEAAAALIASVALVGAARRWARRRNVLDHANDRSLHLHPTPRGGGIGIVIPVCAAIAVAEVFIPELKAAALWIAGIGLLVAAVGLADDLRGLPALTRLVAHLSAGILVVVGIGTWTNFAWPGLWSLDLGWAAIPFTVLLVAGFINAYNFMDGVDGIAGGQGVVAGLGWIGAGYALHAPLVIVAGTAIASASLGFLFFNWPPASIFMGDVGSGFLGFVLAALVVFVSPRSHAAATAGILFIWPFVFDTAFTLVRRARRGENLLSAHRSHLYQRLVLTGISHRAVALLYAVLASVGVAGGVAVARDARLPSIAAAFLIPSLAAGLWLVVIWRERHHPIPAALGPPLHSPAAR